MVSPREENVASKNRPARPQRLRLTSRRTVVVSPVFDTYWRFTCERQSIFHRRVAGLPPPWTTDPILSRYRFTNAYRAADRVSQYLIANVLYSGPQSAEESFFRCILFKLFNRIDTWEHLTARLGELAWSTYSYARYTEALDELARAGQRLYSAAYIMPPPLLGEGRKHENHLRLLERLMVDEVPSRTATCHSLEEVYELLLSYPSLGPFLAFQLAIDLNYSAFLSFSEREFVVAGPGAREGLRKCFLETGGLSDADLIRATADMALSEIDRLGLTFRDLWGRPLQLIDCQNLFCEVGKYARVAHPESTGDGDRTRIKQRFTPTARPVPQWYPPKWHLTPGIDTSKPVV